jgi:polyisoprenoid-binding protein YceI
MKILTRLTIVTVALLMALPALAARFELDRAHSSVTFKVSHLAISKVKGEFTDFDATFDYTPEQPETWRAEATIQAASINTGNAQRDDHLRSPDFLEAEKFPTLTFVSTGAELTGENRGRLTGDLTLHGVTRPVVLDLEIRGMVEFMGTTKAGFTATGVINRRDFGLTWSKVLETGGLVVGDEVEITLEIEGDMVPEVATEQY